MPRNRILGTVLAVLLLVAATACQAEETAAVTAEEGATADLPDWLNRVYPPPGAEAAVNDAIQVDYDVAGPDQTVRLSVDGVDVTAYADIQPGELQYDMDEGRAPAELDPGTHAAMVELVDAAEYGEQPEVLDRCEWEFTLL
jgi:hypothetical protein